MVTITVRTKWQGFKSQLWPTSLWIWHMFTKLSALFCRQSSFLHPFCVHMLYFVLYTSMHVCVCCMIFVHVYVCVVWMFIYMKVRLTPTLKKFALCSYMLKNILSLPLVLVKGTNNCCSIKLFFFNKKNTCNLCLYGSVILHDRLYTYHNQKTGS